MLNLIKLIEKRSEQLHQNSLCRWISGEASNHLSAKEVLGFAPSMLYFVLGFRDILQNLEYPKPQNEIEFIVNQHCHEDKNHWRWYLEDLKTLGFIENSWDFDLSSKIEMVWADSNRPTRELVYLCIYLIKKYRSAKASLVIIECLEATFGVFMTCLQNRFWNSQDYLQLKFFGQVHFHQEMNHSLGHWIGDLDGHSSSSPHYYSHLQLAPEEEADLMTTIQLIFEQFELVFESWYGSRGDFTHPVENQSLQINSYPSI